MNSNLILDKNIKALSKVDEPLSVAMRELLTQNKPLRYTRKGENNFFDNLLKIPMYADADYEFKQRSEHFKAYEKYPVIFIFGFGNGRLIEHLLKNHKHKRVIVFDNELDPIFYTLYKFDFARDIRYERLILFFVPNLNPAQFATLFTYKDIDISLKTYNLTAESNYYEKYFSEQIKAVHKQLVEAVRFAFIRKGNDPMDSVHGIEHTMQNLPKMLSHPPFQAFLLSFLKALFAPFGLKALSLQRAFLNYHPQISPQSP